MKICVLLPTEEQKSQAGVRIRYERIAPSLVKLGFTLDLLPIAEMNTAPQLVHDVYLISKVYDARAIVIAAQLKVAGKLVGVDMFDDYFSQRDDSRFFRLRYWLRKTLEHAAFALCSTPGMRAIVAQYAPQMPALVMNDPAAEFDTVELSATLARRLLTARSSARIDVAWFGMGDNPTFPVGLADLAAFGAHIDRLHGYGFKVNLSVLTNKRAMTPELLSSVRRLSTQFTLDEWDEQAEAELLSSSLISFLPVNMQNFSRVKSLNRAVTALTAGSQVLSIGYPLYAPLSPFVYRDADSFLRDLGKGSLALRADTVSQFGKRMQELADVDGEAAGLVQFLTQVRKDVRNVDQVKVSLALIHGKESKADFHKFAQKRGALSVASPMCKTELNYDLRFERDASGRGLDVWISSKRVPLLASQHAALLTPAGRRLTTDYSMLNSSSLMPHDEVLDQHLSTLNAPASDAVLYPALMGRIERILGILFPGIACAVAEQSKRIPWHVNGPASEVAQ